MTDILNQRCETLSTVINVSGKSGLQGGDRQIATEPPDITQPTPTRNAQRQRLADFATLTEALEYAADGSTGYNFYDGRGKLRSVLPYRELRARAREAARRMHGLNLRRGDHVALIADTTPEFVILFFACRYAGLVPFAMPVPINLGSHDIYVQQLRGMLESSEAAAAFANLEFVGFLEEAAEGLDHLHWVGTPERLDKLPAVQDIELQPNHPDEIAYLQFTSGSTRNPQAVIITERAAMNNLQGITRYGLAMHPEDRCASWLPFYHDMGLVGLVMSPMVAQLSVDFLSTRDFAMRPLQWLRLISRNRCTIAFSQPFGLKLCTLRARSGDLDDLDLSCWRAAGVGAEMIRPDILRNFAEKFEPTGFRAEAFLPCYGLAEATLAVSFAEIGKGFDSLRLDSKSLVDRNIAVRVRAEGRSSIEFVNCGRPLPGLEIKIADDDNEILPDLRIGRVLMRGPSIMSGYHNSAEDTARALQPVGWLDSGDLGFLFNGNLYITGRRTDVIIVNGRNIRAQDIESLAEQQEEVKTREVSAFGIVDAAGDTNVVLVIEHRSSSVEQRQALITRLQRLVYLTFGVRCLVELVPPHTLPRTSSGKLSRTAARKGFLERANLTETKVAQSDSG